MRQAAAAPFAVAALAAAVLVAAGALVAAPAAAQEPTSLEARAASLVALRSLAIDIAQGEPSIDEALRVPAADRGEEIVIVKFDAPPSKEQLAVLATASLRVYTYLPFYAYLVRVQSGTADKVQAQTGASWTGVYHPAYKISPEIAAVGIAEAKPTTSRAMLRPVLLHLYPDTDVDAVRGELASLGAARIAGSSRGAFFARVRLLLDDGEIAALRVPLAQLADVFWIELEGRRTLVNDSTIWVGQSGLSGGMTTPIFARGIFGQGQTVAVLDTGIDADMCYFRHSAASGNLPPANACNGGTTVDLSQRKVLAVDFLAAGECAGGIGSNEWDTHDHGSHVAGTFAGDDFAQPLLHDGGDGMAPGARLVIQDGGFGTDNCGDLPGIGCPVVDLVPLFQQTYDQGARIHTNSWGDNENAPVQNNYSAASQDVDEFMWSHPDFLVFFAAGNSGPGNGSVGSPSTAKSGVSVGATFSGTNAGFMASFSSCGPTADARIKPEVTVPGSGIFSANADNDTTSNNCSTRSMSGTSMATPGAAGLSALIRQYFVEGWVSGFRNQLQGMTPSAALVRATLVNSAENMTGATAIPSNCQGWGRVLLDNALYFAGDARQLWVRDNVGAFANGSSNESRHYLLAVNAGQPLKVTLAWTDFPSTPAASVNLVNDLDLEVIGPTGTIWRGNVFAGGVSTTGGAADRRNTLEQVLLAAPAAGIYKVSVRSFAVPSGPQPFALVVTASLVPGS